MTNNIADNFHETISKQLEKSSLTKLIISNKRNKKEELKSVIIKPVQIKTGLKLCFVYRYPTKDITKNFDYNEGEIKIKELLEATFKQADLFSIDTNWHLNITKSGNANLTESVSNASEKPQLNHDNQKKRLITTTNNIYFKELGITNSLEQVKPSMQDKFRQINKYIEIIEGVLKTAKINSPFYVADMGSGKGYLTFALYDYLKNTLNLETNIIGVEFRKELVEKCNSIAQKCEFNNLNFIEGSIENAELKQIDLLIALHACDTATDDAIFRGINAGAKIIICAPCCHKQIRKQLNPTNELNIISQYGILKERQAEIITDTIRSQILEAFGYKTKAFEFISTEHTPKNVMLIGVNSNPLDVPKQNILDGIKRLKDLHGIKYHYLEKLLKIV